MITTEHQRMYARDYYWANRDKYQVRRKENDNNKKQCKRYYREHKDDLYLKEKQRKENHPEKFNAKWKVEVAIKKGVLRKPNKCQNCDIETKVQAHHEDYNKPLVVMWLCRECHNKIHFRKEAD